MTWHATTRFRLNPAPSSLGLVQDFLLTGGDQGDLAQARDLLGSGRAAQAWLKGAAREWADITGRSAPPVELTDRDAELLRKFRTALFAHVSNKTHGVDPDPAFASTYRTTATIEVDEETGAIVLTPQGRGWKAVVAWILLEIHMAEREGLWPRFKACKNTRCRGVFFDNSRNNSGAWHDVRTCGNVANLRASRARKKAREAEPA